MTTPRRIQRRRTKGWRDTSEHAEAKRTRHLHLIQPNQPDTTTTAA